VKHLTEYTRKIDEMYGQKINEEVVPHEERICATMAESEVPASRTSVHDIAENWIPAQITNIASA
jgi:hypothetical protein